MMECKSCSPKDEAVVTALWERLQNYYGRDSDFTQDIKVQEVVRALRAKLLAFDMEHRAPHEACVADVLPIKGTEDLGQDAMESDQFGNAQRDDPLDEVNIGDLDETPRPTFLSRYLAPEDNANQLVVELIENQSQDIQPLVLVELIQTVDLLLLTPNSNYNNSQRDFHIITRVLTAQNPHQSLHPFTTLTSTPNRNELKL
ncbi:hypothetical protein Droror1_Dr00023771 [Drosera rotundifolia]